MVTPDLTPERRSENLRLREAATPGPWKWTGRDNFRDVPAMVLANEMRVGSKGERTRKGEVCRVHDGDGRYDRQTDADVSYIVAACNDLPLYEAALAEAEREIERLQKRISNFELQAGVLP